MNIELILSIIFFMLTLLLMYVASEINLSSDVSSYRIRNYISGTEKQYQEYFNWFTLKCHDLRELFEEEINIDFKMPFDEFCYSIYTGSLKITYN